MILEGKKRLSLAVFILLLLTLLLFEFNNHELQEFRIEGSAMGTRYSIVIKTDKDIDLNIVSDMVNSIFDNINDQMSTYQSDSEISYFNKKNNENRVYDFKVSQHFFNVLKKSKYYNQISNGMFDITVHPLYKAWGFQNKDLLIEEPSSSEIKKILKFVGGDKILIQNGYLSAVQKGVSIDVSAIAKGYTIDIISSYLQNEGYLNHLIEIGGEFRVSSYADNYWPIGIQEPDMNKIGKVNKVVYLYNNSIATSGSYSNFIEYLNSGIKRTHIINPKTGYPLEIKDGIISSATVIASSCLEADALATTLMLLSKQDGLDMIDSIDNVEAYIIYLEDGKLHSAQSKGFVDYVSH